MWARQKSSGSGNGVLSLYGSANSFPLLLAYHRAG